MILALAFCSEKALCRMTVITMTKCLQKLRIPWPSCYYFLLPLFITGKNHHCCNLFPTHGACLYHSYLNNLYPVCYPSLHTKVAFLVPKYYNHKSWFKGYFDKGILSDHLICIVVHICSPRGVDRSCLDTPTRLTRM